MNGQQYTLLGGANAYLKVFLATSWCVYCSVLIVSDLGSFDVGGGLVYASFLGFLAFLIVGLVSERRYWQFAPYVFLFIPNAVNDLFPSAPMSTGADAPYFSFFTHIDIYLLAGVLAYCNFNRKISRKKLIFLSSACILAIVVIFVAAMDGRVPNVLLGFFQIRYLIFILVLILFASPYEYVEDFIDSFKIVLLLVVVEAAIFSLLKGEQRLTSGNFGVNSLGHLLAAGVALLLFRFRASRRKILDYVLAFALTISIIATGTRFSLVALMLACLSLYSLKNGRLSSMVIGFFLLCVAGFLLTNFTPFGASIVEGIVMVGDDFDNPSAITITPDSSSMITRLILWWSSIDMARDNLLLGVGPGVWSFLKTDYGIVFESILDPHQDILNYIVSYGILCGLVWFLTIFALPPYMVYKFKYSYGSWNMGLVAIILVFLFAGITNAVTWKHQIAALVYFSSFMIIFAKRDSVRNDA